MVCALALAVGAERGVAQESLKGASAQERTSQRVPPQSANDALREMSRLAGVIFTGEVTSVRRLVGTNGETGVVEIAFAVEDAIRGVSGGSYTLREWAGLWEAGDTPLRVGQSYLMLLHAPSAAGLSSPVGGMDGAIPICGGIQTDASGDGRAVDLRWVGTHVARSVAYRARGSAPEASVDSSSGSSTLQGSSYASVLGLLRGWETADAAAR